MEGINLFQIPLHVCCICVCSYNELYVVVLRNTSDDGLSSDVALYKISGDGMDAPRLAHILLLDLTGAFALHVFDNLVVVHHQTSKASLVFDIGLETSAKSDCISHRPFLKTSLNCLDLLLIKLEREFPLYSPSWVMFQPNLIADASVGVFTAVTLDPLGTVGFIEDKVFSLSFCCCSRKCIYISVCHRLLCFQTSKKQVPACVRVPAQSMLFLQKYIH
ncbi:unnamed protein product [Gongylonema pulchrum]|uniref:MMS1_N domain-containing protein n=1 Tax=Gongylonema pulchrum TaxID=637853 RepID=A0A183ESC7_9BILA|nr:unnamed protein product [Gongylonema pulchrum]